MVLTKVVLMCSLWDQEKFPHQLLFPLGYTLEDLYKKSKRFLMVTKIIVACSFSKGQYIAINVDYIYDSIIPIF
mgnify:CR=1 FL=1